MNTTTTWRTNIIAALSSTFIHQALAAIAQVLIIRMLSSTGYGTYTTLYAWLAITNSVMGAGLDLWLLDYGSRNIAQLRPHMTRIVFLKTGLWMITALVVLWQVPTLDHTLLVLGLIIVYIESISTTFIQSLRALNHHRMVALIQLIGPSIMVIALVVGQPRHITWILGIQIINASVLFGISYALLMRRMPASSTAQSALLQSTPFIVSDILAQIYTYSSTILLAQYATTQEVGIFRGAWSFIAYTVVVPSILFSTTLPLLNNTQPLERSTIIRRSAIAFSIYAISVSLFVVLGGGQTIVWLFGESFAPSVAFIPHLIMLPFIKACTFFGVMLLIHQHRVRWRIVVQTGTVIVLWLIMPPLIAQFDIIGAIYAQLITEGVLACGYILGGLWRISNNATNPPTWPPRNIVVSNMHGRHNLGDAAIHDVQHAWLQRQFPNACIHQCYAISPSNASHQGISHWVYDINGQIAPLPTRIRRMCAIIWSIATHSIGITATWGMSVAERHTFITLITSDLVCASGGGYLYDLPSNHPWWRFITWDWWICADLLIAIIWNKPVVLLPQSIGPLHNPPFRRLVCWILTKAHCVYVRESQSAHFLDALHVPYQKAPDFVWDMAQPHVLPPTTPPTLGITLMDWGGQTGNKTQQLAYESTMITVAHHMHQAGWRIQLYAQATDRTPGWNDAIVVQRLAQQLPFATVIIDSTSPDELQQHYARLTCLVTTRLHGALMRFAMNQSAIVIAYHPKAVGIMNDIGLEAWCIPIDTMTPEAILTAIHSHTNQIAYISAHRQQCVADLNQLRIAPPQHTH